MSDKLWDVFVNALIAIFMPLVCSYFSLCSNAFLNISAQDASGLERIGNYLLAPTQYIFAGQEAIPQEDGSWRFVQRFDYAQNFWLKTASSLIALPPSLLFGGAAKGLGLLSQTSRMRHNALVAALHSTKVHSNSALYKEMGIPLDPPLDHLVSQGHQRRPGDENALSAEKKALQEIAALLNAAEIPWWVDCGTCLGTYRYGGVIPWDEDLDIAVLLPDFENVCHALNRLDPEKYTVQNWSSRDMPESYLKVYIRETNTLIDIYFFAIAPESRQFQYILSLEKHLFFPEWWKIRERRFKAPVAFETVFPLKKAFFDGVEVYVPNDTKKYLQRVYGEDLAPAKVYDPFTGGYEKDLSHPYWQRAYVH